MAWIPEDNITGSRKAAQTFWQTPAGGYGDGIGGGLAAALSGLGFGLMNTDASNATQANQTMRSDLMKSAASAPNNMSMGKLLMAGGVPDLEGQGMSTIAGARDKADAYGQQKSMAELQHRQSVALQGGSQAHAERMANLQHNLQVKLSEAKSEQERQALLRTARMLGLVPPEVVSPPAASSAVPGVPTAPMPQPTETGAVSGIPAPMPQPQTQPPPAAPSVVPDFSRPDQATVPPPAAPTGTANIDPERKNRAGLALLMGDKATAAKILTEAPDKDGDKAYDVEMAKGDAKQVQDMVSSYPGIQQNLGKIGVMRQLSTLIGNPGIGNTIANSRLGQAARAVGLAPEQMATVEGFTAMVNQMVPAQRPPGSGTMSDKDVDLFKNSLANVAQTKEGREFILAQSEAINRYDAARAVIAQDIRARRIGRSQGMDKMMALPNPLAGLEQNLKTFGIAGAGQPNPIGQQGAGQGGTRYRNPQTGQVIEWNGSQWVSVGGGQTQAKPQADANGIPYPPASR